MNNTSKKTVFTIIYKLLYSGIVFLNGVLTARFLSKPDRAEYSYALNVNNIGMTYVGGYTGYYAYALSRDPENAEDIVQMGNLFVFTAALVIWLVMVLSKWLILPHLHSTTWESAWWALVSMPMTFIFGFGSRILQGSNNMKWLNRSNMFQPILFFVAYVPIFFDKHIHENLRLTISYMTWVTSFGVAALATMVIAYRVVGKAGVTKWKFRKAQWKGTIGYGSFLSISNIVNIFNYRMDFLMVYYLAPSTEAAAYSVAVTASEVLLTISGSVAQVMFTRMTSGNRKDAIQVTELSSRHTIISSTIVAIFMFVAFPTLIVVAFGHRYSDAVLPFLILLPGLVVKAASNIVIQYFTNHLANPKSSIWMNGISAILNALFCLLLVPHLGATGGAIASTVSYSLSYVVYVWWFARVNDASARGLYLIQKEDLAPYLLTVRKVFHRIFAK